MTIKAKDLQQNSAYYHKEKYNIQLYKNRETLGEAVSTISKDEVFLVVDITKNEQEGSCWIHVLAKEKPGFIFCTPNFDKFLEFGT